MHGHVTLLSWTPDMEAMIASGGRISTMDGTADEIRAKSLAAGKEKNEKLIGKVLSSGHTSVLEHGYVNLAFEIVSVLAEQFLIEFRLASFTVKSRRYVDFSGAGYVAPELPSPQAQALIDETVRELFRIYDELAAVLLLQQFLLLDERARVGPCDERAALWARKGNPGASGAGREPVFPVRREAAVSCGQKAGGL